MADENSILYVSRLKLYTQGSVPKLIKSQIGICDILLSKKRSALALGEGRAAQLVLLAGLCRQHDACVVFATRGTTDAVRDHANQWIEDRVTESQPYNRTERISPAARLLLEQRMKEVHPIMRNRVAQFCAPLSFEKKWEKAANESMHLVMNRAKAIQTIHKT